MQHPKSVLTAYLNQSDLIPLFITGDSFHLLKDFPDDCIDCVITSPPYWGQRSYENGGIGLENTPEEFISNLLAIIAQIRRVLKPTGSFWLNLGDTYKNKSLLGIPWRVALTMIDEQKWVLRNSVIWNKQKGGMDSTSDRLRNVHENLFHFVKSAKGYYYDDDSVRSKPRQAIVRNGAVMSATGVSGKRYRRQIELTTSLTSSEKEQAMKALDLVLTRVVKGEIADFRMIIRDMHRATHSDQTKVSGRARELQEKGFYFLFYHPNGTLPGDVWDIIPEDTQKREKHYAVYPEDLCRVPILSTCPPDGVVLDPFCGSGTTNKVALDLNRRSIGIDQSAAYLAMAEKRIMGETLKLML